MTTDALFKATELLDQLTPIELDVLRDKAFQVQMEIENQQKKMILKNLEEKTNERN